MYIEMYEIVLRLNVDLYCLDVGLNVLIIDVYKFFF